MKKKNIKLLISLNKLINKKNSLNCKTEIGLINKLQLKIDHILYQLDQNGYDQEFVSIIKNIEKNIFESSNQLHDYYTNIQPIIKQEEVLEEKNCSYLKYVFNFYQSKIC